MEERVEAVDGKASGRERSLQNLVPFKPGQSGNPLGAKLPQLSFAAYIRSQTNQGKELVDFALSVLRGENAGPWDKLADRLTAMKWLADRAYGQSPQTIQFGTDPENRPLLDLTKLTPAEFEQFKSLALKIAPTAPEGESEPKPASTVAPESTISPQDVPKVQPPDNLGSSGMKP